MKHNYISACGLALILSATAFASREKVQILAPAEIPTDAVVKRVNPAIEPTRLSAESFELVNVDDSGVFTGNKTLSTRADDNDIPEGFQMALNLQTGEAWVTKCTATGAEVTIPDQITVNGKTWPVTVIYNKAFSGLNAMTTVNFGKNIKYIDTQAFIVCMKLTTVNMNEGLVEIGPQAFSTFCSAIKSITLPSTVETLGEKCFSGTGITGEFIINKSLKNIGAGAFSGKKISGFYIGEQGNDYFTSLDGVLFTKDETSLVVYPPALIEAEMTLPSNIKKLAPYCFAYCTTLKKITLPEGLTAIGEYAFRGCNLQEFTIGKNVTDLGYGVFQDNKSLNTITIEAGNTSFTSTNGMIIGKANKTLLAVPYNITEVNIPEGVDTVGDYTCYGNANVVSVTAPSVKVIGTSAFSGCSGLTKIELSAIDSIATYGFSKCGAVEKVTFPATLKALGNYVFSNSGVKEVSFQDGLQSMGFGVFMQSQIETCNIPGTVKNLGESLFYQCPNLANLKLNEGMPYIPGTLAYGCEKLYFLDFPSTIKYVGNAAFGFSWLQLAELPEGVTKVGDGAFQLAPLHYIDLPNSLEEIGNIAFSITNAEYIKCGSGLKSVGSNCFQSNRQAKTITLNEGLESLGMRALYGEDGVSEITIPASVVNIGDSLLLNTKLPKLINLSPVPQKLNSIITGIYNPYPTVTPIYDSCTLYVPAGTKEAYMQAPYWKLYDNIIELEGSDVRDLEHEETVKIVKIYNTSGCLLEELQEGLNICIMSDGTVKKEIVRK